MEEKLTQAIRGVTVTITAEELNTQFIESFDEQSTFASLADVQAWCTTFSLTFTDNGDNTYTISKS